MAAEDYSGNSSLTTAGPRPGPEYLSYYTTALQDAGISYDVYDVDAHSRTAPDPIGVLSHYKSVIWYTGDDLYVREPTQPGATGNSKLADDEVIAVRDYMNDGGTVLVTGQSALQGAWDQFLYNPLGAPPNPFCKTNNSQGQGNVDDPVGQKANCVIVSNDFVQYYLGAWINIIAAEGDDVATLPFKGAGGPFGTTPFTLNGAGSADNQLQRVDVRDDLEHPAQERVPAVRLRSARSSSTARRPSTRRRGRSTPTRSPATRAGSGCAARST